MSKLPSVFRRTKLIFGLDLSPEWRSWIYGQIHSLQLWSLLQLASAAPLQLLDGESIQLTFSQLRMKCGWGGASLTDISAHKLGEQQIH